MKVHILLACLAVGSLFVANIAFATEQKVVFNIDSFKIRGSKTTTEKCESACRAKFGEGKIEPLLASGWKIVSFTSKEAICIDDWAVFQGEPLVQGCSGTGTQFVLQKDDPPPAKAEIPNKELDLLKQENDLLKREIALLKQENEKLKNELKTKQKPKSEKN